MKILNSSGLSFTQTQRDHESYIRPRYKELKREPVNSSHGQLVTP